MGTHAVGATEKTTRTTPLTHPEIARGSVPETRPETNPDTPPLASLSADDVEAGIVALWREYGERRDQALRDRLMLHYSPLVKYVAGRMASGRSAPTRAPEASRMSMPFLCVPSHRPPSDRG